MTRAAARLLIVIDEPCASPELCARVRAAHTDDRPLEAFVIAPTHELPATQWYVDEDAARADAAHRLRACLACLGRAGVRVAGRLGDRDPVQAIADGLYEFAADEILIVTAPQRRSRRARHTTVDRARDRFPQPIRQIST